MNIKTLIERISCYASKIVGNSYAFVYATLAVIIWGVMGPLYKFSDGWQLFMTVSTNIISFLMLFLIENSQHRDTALTQEDFEEIKSLLKQNKVENTSTIQAKMKSLHDELTDEQITEENLTFARNIRRHGSGWPNHEYSVIWNSKSIDDTTETLFSSDPVDLHLKHLTRYHQILIKKQKQ